jgi:hypothetical protein
VPEVVVVRLEPVDVEQGERVQVAALDRALQVQHQPAAIPETGDGVGLRLALGDGKQSEMV